MSLGFWVFRSLKHASSAQPVLDTISASTVSDRGKDRKLSVQPLAQVGLGRGADGGAARRRET